MHAHEGAFCAPTAERLFRTRYKKAPSFLSIHLGIRADVLPPGSGGWVSVGGWEQRNVCVTGGCLQSTAGLLCPEPCTAPPPSLPPECHQIIVEDWDKMEVGGM